jgi:hypothetical protein
MAFVKAQKSAASIKIAICGQSGAGKTTGALMIASGLGGKIAVLDTENTSAALKSDEFDFDVWDGQPGQGGFAPDFFIKVIKEAEKANYKTLIIDSITHEWFGRGGCLDIQNTLANTRYKGNSTAAWREVTPRHQAFIDAIQSANINIICTIRSKPAVVISKDENGKTTVKRVGLEPMQREGIEYEFTIFFDVERENHYADALKDRTMLFKTPQIIDIDTGRKIAAWLTGAAPSAAPLPQEQSTPSNADRARSYVNIIAIKRFNEGEPREKILKDFADLLKTDQIKEIEDLNDTEIRCLGNALKALEKKQ